MSDARNLHVINCSLINISSCRLSLVQMAVIKLRIDALKRSRSFMVIIRDPSFSVAAYSGMLE